jgi:hypothetical protein
MPHAEAMGNDRKGEDASSPAIDLQIISIHNRSATLEDSILSIFTVNRNVFIR